MTTPSWPAMLTDAIFLASVPWQGQVEAHVRLDLSLDLSFEHLQRAVEATIADLPVLGCRYVADPRQDRWEPTARPLSDTVIADTDPGDPDAVMAKWLQRPLESEVGRPWRVVWMPRREGGCRLLVTFLHLVVDGGGMMATAQVLGAHLLGKAPALPVETRRDPALGLERLPRAAWPLALASGVRELLQPLKLWGADVMGSLRRSEQGPPCWTTITLEPEELARFKAACKAQGATVNDGLVAAVARAGGRRRRRGPLGAIYTIDLRRYLDPPRLVVANLSGLLLVTIPRALLDSPEEAVAAVAAENQRLDWRFRGLIFCWFPWLVGPITRFGAYRDFVTRYGTAAIDWLCQRALIVTNVGRLDDGLAVFEGHVEAMTIIGPTARYMPMPVSAAWGHEGRLHVHLYGAPGTDAAELEALAADIRAGLKLG